MSMAKKGDSLSMDMQKSTEVKTVERLAIDLTEQGSFKSKNREKTGSTQFRMTFLSFSWQPACRGTQGAARPL